MTEEGAMMVEGRRRTKTQAQPLTIAVTAICPLDPVARDAAEPYVLVLAVDLAAVPLPRVRATRYGPWGDPGSAASRAIPPDLPPAAVDALANYAVLGRPCWGFDGRTARPIADLADVILLVALLAREDDPVGALRELAEAAVAAGLIDPPGLDRAGRVRHLLAILRSVLALPDQESDAPGEVRELALTPPDLDLPRFGPHARSLVVANDHGRYRIEFGLWRD